MGRSKKDIGRALTPDTSSLKKDFERIGVDLSDAVVKRFEQAAPRVRRSLDQVVSAVDAVAKKESELATARNSRTQAVKQQADIEANLANRRAQIMFRSITAETKLENDLAEAKRATAKADQDAVRISSDIEKALRKRTDALKAFRKLENDSRSSGGSSGRGRGNQSFGSRRASAFASSFPGVPSGLGSPLGPAVVVGLVGGAGLIAKAAVTASQAIWLLPAAAVAAGAGIGTLALATHGFDDALKHMGDPKKFAEALKGLSPNAQQAALAIKKLSDGPLKDLQQATQDAFFSGMGENLWNLTSRFAAPVKGLTTSIATSFNEMFKGISDQLLTPDTQGALQNTFNNIGLTFKNLAPAGASLADAFTRIVATGSGFLPGLASGLADAAGKFADFIREAQQSGKLEGWIQAGVEAAKALGGAIYDVGKKIYDAFGSSSVDDFKSGLDTIVNLIGDVVDGISTLGSVANFLSQHTELVWAAVAAWSAFQALKLTATIMDIGTSLTGVSVTLTSLPGLASGALAPLAAAGGPIALVTALGVAIVYAVQGLEKLTGIKWSNFEVPGSLVWVLDRLSKFLGIDLGGDTKPTGTQSTSDPNGLRKLFGLPDVAPSAPGGAATNDIALPPGSVPALNSILPALTGQRQGPGLPGNPGGPPLGPGIGPYPGQMPVPGPPLTGDHKYDGLNLSDYLPPGMDAAGATAPGGIDWDAVAKAESSGNWQNADTGGNGHYGGLQFSPQTWNAYGGQEFAPMPNQASREQQIEIANRTAFSGYNGTAPQGLGAWETIAKGMVPGVSVNSQPGMQMPAGSPAGNYGAPALSGDMSGINLSGAHPQIGVVAQIAKSFGLDMTAGKDNHGTDGGYHPLGEAGDFGNGDQTAQETAFSNYMSENFGPYLAELIHQGPGTIQNVKDGKATPDIDMPGSVYNTGQAGYHGDHVHIAVTDQMAAQFAQAAGGAKPPISYGNDGKPYAAPGYGYYDVDQQKITEAKQAVHNQGYDLGQARMDEVATNRDPTANDREKADAHEKVIEQEQQYNNSLAKLAEVQQGTWKKLDSSAKGFANGMQQIGSQLDSDFGISKGLPGIFENLTKMIANLAMAPVIGALTGVTASYGTAGPGTGLLGGLAPRQNIFGQEMPNILGQYGQKTDSYTPGWTPGTPSAASGPPGYTPPPGATGIPGLSLPGTPAMTTPGMVPGLPSPWAPGPPTGPAGAAPPGLTPPTNPWTGGPGIVPAPGQGVGPAGTPLGPMSPPGTPPGTPPGGGSYVPGSPFGPSPAYAPGSSFGPLNTGTADTAQGGIVQGQGMPSSPGIGFGGGLIGMAESLPGAAASAFPGGAAAAAGAQIGIDEINRAVGFGAQAVGIGVEGLMETFLPVDSELADPTRGWAGRILGAVAGVKPAAKNIAGDLTKGTGGQDGQGGKPLSPEQVAAQKAKDNPGRTDVSGDTNITVNANTNNPTSLATEAARHVRTANALPGPSR